MVAQARASETESTSSDRAGEQPARSAAGESGRNENAAVGAPTRSRAFGGIAAQGSQALASFALQFVAARYLGLHGLGEFAVLFGVIVVATAVSSGFVGDSLTVLDRRRTAVRAGLQSWLAMLALGAGAIGAAVAGLAGFLSPAEAMAFGLATATFLVEDTLRRLLMATMQFWRIVIVDITAMVASLAVVVVASAKDGVTLGVLLLALAVGQVVATAAGWWLLPRVERFLVPMRAAALGEVAAYGTWRALQQAVRAGTLALVRVICLLLVTSAAVGGLEAARIYMAPAVLAVSGVSSYLFASYASSPTAPLERLLHLADQSVVKLLVGVLSFGLIGVVAIPVLAPVLTNGEYELSAIAVAGWAVYAAAIAGVTPYGQLASVRGRHVSVFVLRLSESTLSLLAIYMMVTVTRAVEWVPLVLAAWSLLGGLLIRELVIKRELLGQTKVSGGGAVA